MSRYLFVLNTQAERKRLQGIVEHAPTGTRVEIKGPVRSLPQNNLMWALLTDISTQLDYPRIGRRVSPDTWKVGCMHAFGLEVGGIPSLDGRELVSMPRRSSEMSKGQMHDFITWLFAFCDERGVKTSVSREDAA